MDAQYIAKEGALVIALKLKEIDRFLMVYSTLIEEDQIKNLVRVPPLNKDFLERVAASQEEKTVVKFGAAYLEFGVAVLEEISYAMADEGLDTSDIVRFLDQVDQFCAPTPTLN